MTIQKPLRFVWQPVVSLVEANVTAIPVVPSIVTPERQRVAIAGDPKIYNLYMVPPDEDHDCRSLKRIFTGNRMFKLKGFLLDESSQKYLGTQVTDKTENFGESRWSWSSTTDSKLRLLGLLNDNDNESLPTQVLVFQGDHTTLQDLLQDFGEYIKDKYKLTECSPPNFEKYLEDVWKEGLLFTHLNLAHERFSTTGFEGTIQTLQNRIHSEILNQVFEQHKEELDQGKGKGLEQIYREADARFGTQYGSGKEK